MKSVEASDEASSTEVPLVVPATMSFASDAQQSRVLEEASERLLRKVRSGPVTELNALLDDIGEYRGVIDDTTALVAVTLMSYGQYGNGTGIRPSQATVRERIGLSLRKVRACIETLEECGILESKQRYNEPKVYWFPRVRRRVHESSLAVEIVVHSRRLHRELGGALGGGSGTGSATSLEPVPEPVGNR
jgi:hypothetical protein